jgi:hypothetical protein
MSFSIQGTEFMKFAYITIAMLLLTISPAFGSKIICMEFHICPKQLPVDTESTLSPYEDAYSAVKKYTKYRISDNPRIAFVHQEELMDIYISTLESNTEWRDYFLYALNKRRTVDEYKSTKYGKIVVESVYDTITNTIYFSNTWSHRNIRDRGLLAHELTHVAQQQSFVSPECQASLEEIALLVGYGYYLDSGYFRKAARKYPKYNEHRLMQEYKNQIGWISVCIDLEPAAVNLF